MRGIKNKIISANLLVSGLKYKKRKRKIISINENNENYSKCLKLFLLVFQDKTNISR